MNHDNFYLGIVDADSILYRVASACEEETQEIAEYTLRSFVDNSIVAPTECKKYIFCFTGGSEQRRNIAVTKPYKGQRKKEKPKHLEHLKKYAISKYNGLIVEPHEADDVVIAIADKYKGWSVLLGIDKDAKQFSTWHHNYSKDETFFVTPEYAQWHLAYQMLIGDAVDNIPGLPNIGPKKAEKLLEANRDKPPMEVVWEAYKDRGMPEEYYEEQYRLLYMLRDIVYPFEKHFIEIETTTTIEKDLSLEEFDFE